MWNSDISQKDCTFIEEQMRQKMLFSMITEEGTQSVILHRLWEVKHILSSLHTFIENTKWLESYVKMISCLLLTCFKGSIQHTLLQTLNDSETLQIQLTDTDMRFANASDASSHVLKSVYQQLWLFVWQHFLNLVQVISQKNFEKSKLSIKSMNEWIWQKLASLTDHFDFRSEELITFLWDSDTSMIVNFQHQIQSEAFYSLNNNSEALVCSICEIFLTISSSEQCASSLKSSLAFSDISVERCCERSFEQIF